MNPHVNRIGIFTKTFQRPNLREVFAAVQQAKFSAVQLNLSSAGLPTIPLSLPDPAKRDIARAARDEAVTVSAVSGTFNLIDRDIRRLETNLRGLGLLAELCEELETPVITLSTGTADPHDLWQAHPDNRTPAAWNRSREGIIRALRVTREYPVDLAFEPEAGNIVRTARDARRMLDEVGSERLGVVLDGANLLSSEPERPQEELFTEATKLLGAKIVLVHAKEAKEGTVSRVPGRGALDWGAYLRAIRNASYEGPVILHGMTEQHAPESLRFLNTALAKA